MPPHGPTNATLLQRRHRCSLQLSARPVIAPGALERPRRAGSGMSPYSAVTARFALRLRQRCTNISNYVVVNSYFETGRRLARNSTAQFSQASDWRNLLALRCERGIKKRTRGNPTTPSGPVQDPVGQFLHASRHDFFGACHRAVKRPPVLAKRRQHAREAGAAVSPRTGASHQGCLACAVTGQPTAQISLS